MMNLSGNSLLTSNTRLSTNCHATVILIICMLPGLIYNACGRHLELAGILMLENVNNNMLMFAYICEHQMLANFAYFMDLTN